MMLCRSTIAGFRFSWRSFALQHSNIQVTKCIATKRYSSNQYYLSDEPIDTINRKEVPVSQPETLNTERDILISDNKSIHSEFDQDKVSRDNHVIELSDNFGGIDKALSQTNEDLAGDVYKEFEKVASKIKIILTHDDQIKSDHVLEALFDKVVEKSVSKDVIDWDEMLNVIRKTEEMLPEHKPSPEELLKIRATRPTSTCSSLINESETLQKLVDLGVDLHNWEKLGQLGLAVKLDFTRDVAPTITFLSDVGIPHDSIGDVLSNSPEILEQTLDDMRTRVAYLISKKFSKKNIVDIILEESKWLTCSVKGIDNRLGFFQKTYGLTGAEVRRLAVWGPRLVLMNNLVKSMTLKNFSLHEEMGFSKDEMKELLLREPYIFCIRRNILIERIDVLHNEVGIPHEILIKFPEAMTHSHIFVRGRHMFLKSLGRAQYDPKLPNYVSPAALAGGTDQQFCKKVARCPDVEYFYRFLRTL